MCSLSAVLGDVASYTTSTKRADKEFDKYQHIVTYSDEHVYLNVDDEVLTFN